MQYDTSIKSVLDATFGLYICRHGYDEKSIGLNGLSHLKCRWLQCLLEHTILDFVHMVSVTFYYTDVLKSL